MSYDLALGRTSHDLALDKKHTSVDLTWIDNAERIAQQIKITLLMWQGEYFLDTTFGVPYLDDILIKNPARASLESLLRARILAVPGVSRVVRLQLHIERDARTLAVTFDVQTAFGNLNRSLTLSR